MPESPLRLIKRVKEFVHCTQIRRLERKLRGIYVLYKCDATESGPPKVADVVYVGLSRNGVLGRLRSHARHKAEEWTHVSVFEVWDNIRDDEIVELEGLFRHIYRKDSAANALNRQGSFRALKSLPKISLSKPKSKIGAE